MRKRTKMGMELDGAHADKSVRSLWAAVYRGHRQMKDRGVRSLGAAGLMRTDMLRSIRAVLHGDYGTDAGLACERMIKYLSDGFNSNGFFTPEHLREGDVLTRLARWNPMTVKYLKHRADYYGTAWYMHEAREKEGVRYHTRCMLQRASYKPLP